MQRLKIHKPAIYENNLSFLLVSLSFLLEFSLSAILFRGNSFPLQPCFMIQQPFKKVKPVCRPFVYQQRLLQTFQLPPYALPRLSVSPPPQVFRCNTDKCNVEHAHVSMHGYLQVVCLAFQLSLDCQFVAAHYWCRYHIMNYLLFLHLLLRQHSFFASFSVSPCLSILFFAYACSRHIIFQVEMFSYFLRESTPLR